MIVNIFSWPSTYTLTHTCRHICHMIALLWLAHKCCCFSVIKSCLILCNPVDCSTPDFPILHCLSEFAQTYIHWGGDAIQLSYPSVALPLLLLHSIFPNIKVFSSESVLWISWPKYWSFNSSTSPSNEHSGLISFRIDWFDILAIQRTLMSLLQQQNSKTGL